MDGNSIGYPTSHIQQQQGQLYTRQPNYQQQSTYYSQPVQRATSSIISTEAGIVNGFERFFSGMSPIRKKRRRRKRVATRK